MLDLEKMMDPSNVSCERAFGILKMYEGKFETAGLSNIFNLTVAKYNRCEDFIKKCDNEVLILANRLVCK